MKLLPSLLFAAAAFATPLVRGQVSLLSHTYGQSTTGNGFGLSPINSTGASFIAVCEAAYTQAVAPTDSQGNTYTLVASKGNDPTVSLWVVFSPATSASHVVTINGNYPAGAVSAYSGVASGPDAGSAFTQFSYAPQATGAVTPANPNELVYSCLAANGDPVSVNAPLTVIDSTAPHANGVGIATAAQIQTTAAAVNPTWNPNGVSISAVNATFYSTASPAPLAPGNPAYFKEGFVGSPYSYQVPIAGGVAPYAVTLTGGTLNAGLTLSSGGKIASSANLSSASVANGLVFHIVDAQGHAADTAPANLTIAAAQLAVSTTSCPVGTQYSVYPGCSVSATGGTAPISYAWSTALGDFGLVEGLAENPTTGAITGTPTGMGVYPVRFTATDAVGTTASGLVNIPINGFNGYAAYGPLFPADNVFGEGLDISGLPADTSPLAVTPLGHLDVVFGQSLYSYGIPKSYVPYNQPNIPVFCPGPDCYQNPVTSGPFSLLTPIENTANDYLNGDGHSIVIQLDAANHPKDLYETNQSAPITSPLRWRNTSNFHWELTGYSWVNAAGSADASGMPIGPQLVDYDQVMSAGGQKTALRFTMPRAQTLARYVWPATDWPHGAAGGSCSGGYVDPSGNGLVLQGALAPTTCNGNSTRIAFGATYRLTAQAYANLPPCMATSPQARSIAGTLRFRGMHMSDVGGDNMKLVGTNDNRWNDSDLSCLLSIPGSSFEMVDMSGVYYADANGVPTSLKIKGATPPPPTKRPYLSGGVVLRGH